MAVVRELVTLLTYKVDEAGLQQYAAGIAGLKKLATSFIAGLGIAFSFEKIYEFTKELTKVGGLINKTQGQIKNLIRPMDDFNSAIDRTFEIAQKTGTSWEDVLGTYKELLNVSQDTKTSQDQLLSSTENIYKAAKIDKSSKEETEQLFSTFNRIFAGGTARPMTIGRIERLSPTVYKMIQEYYESLGKGGNLRELAKAKQIKSEDLIKALGTFTPEMEERFNKVPWAFGRAMTYAYNELAKLMAAFIKAGKISFLLGGAIKRATDIVIASIKAITEWGGGLTNVLRVLAIAIALAFGPVLITMITTATAAMTTFATATLAATWPWLALGVAVTAAALAIDDFIGWIEGKDTVIGSWLGPFEAVKKQIIDTFGLQPIVDFIDKINTSLKPISDMLDMLGKGDVMAGWKAMSQIDLFKLTVDTWNTLLPDIERFGAKLKEWTGIDIFGETKTELGLMWTEMQKIDSWLRDSWIGKILFYQIQIPSWMGGPKPQADTPGAVVPETFTPMPPGALGPRAIGASNDNRNQSVMVTHNPTNNITVTTDDQASIARIIQDNMYDISRNTADAIAKQIITAAPRTEAATQ
jgi:hypothetical protein